jgi:hypothetical protein
MDTGAAQRESVTKDVRNDSCYDFGFRGMTEQFHSGWKASQRMARRFISVSATLMPFS